MEPLKSSNIKVESRTSGTPISDAQEFEIEFMKSIDVTHELKCKVHKKFTEYDKRLEVEVDQRFFFRSELQKEVESCRNLGMKNNELIVEISSLTKLNETLSRENNDMKKELQQCQNNINNLLQELNAKVLQLNELDKDYQMLLNEKTSFRKNFKDRLKSFINDMSFSDADNSDKESSVIDDLEESVQVNKKRRHEFDSDISSIQYDYPMAKRSTYVDPNSTDPNYVSTNDCVQQDEPDESVVENQPNSDDQITQTNDEPVEENATADVEVETDCVAAAASNDRNDNLAVVLYENPIQEKRRHFRRNIQKVMDFENLTAETKIAYQKEKERKKRYARRLQRFTETYATLPGELNELEDLLLDFDLDTKRELLTVDKRLSSKLKPHQCEGVKFMWDVCFESIDKLRSSNGSGCILSHCMGLGKTLQVITLVHTLLTHSRKTKVTKVLIICPVNVILNWVDEFEIWLKEFPKQDSIKIYELVTCSSDERTNRMKSWHKDGGVFIIGYKMYQMMYQNMKRTKSSATESYILYNAFIDPGADLVVCDEGHLLKNPSSQLSLAINKVRTLRRIILTGTPLQNNLKEYYSMVGFVKPGLLGTEKEFNNRFVGPIVNGQFVDSTDEDITLMKDRAYILHKLLEGSVHRRDYSVLAKFLPPKQEYVLFIRLTTEQIDLYKFYMGNFIESKPVADLPALKRICNHPKTLADSIDRRKSKQSTAQKSDNDEIGEQIAEKNKNNTEWWKPICTGDRLEMSNKMLILLTILCECEARDEKLIIFSGCLSTLNVIEHYLAQITETTRKTNPSSTQYKGIWVRDVDYSRLDGSQSAEKRKRDITRFNRETNTRTRLFLISTKAGGLGINLMGANRVVIFDASWNPSDDIQSIFRTYRIGQKKECFIYRFVALGTMEEKIYDRQVSKLSIAKRVIDEHQISRHYKEEDLQQLYCINDLDPPTNHTFNPTEDNLLNSILRKYPDVIYKHHDHDSLLENVTGETLTVDEVGDVWEEFD